MVVGGDGAVAASFPLWPSAARARCATASMQGTVVRSCVTAVAGATGSVYSTMIWKMPPPCVNFVGAVKVLTTINTRMAVALIRFIAVVAARACRSTSP